MREPNAVLAKYVLKPFRNRAACMGHCAANLTDLVHAKAAVHRDGLVHNLKAVPLMNRLDQQRSVVDLQRHPRHQALVVNPVKELREVQVYDNVVACLHMLLGFCDGRMTASLRTEPVAGWVKSWLKAWLKAHAYRLLDHPVLHVGNAKATHATTRLGYLYPPNGLWPVRARPQCARQLTLRVWPVQLDLPDRATIRPCYPFVPSHMRECLIEALHHTV